MLKRNRIALIGILTFIFFASCSKEDVRIPNFFEDFVTVEKTNAIATVLLDNGDVLNPQNSGILKIFENGDRAVLNYTPLKEKSEIFINNIRPVFLDTIKEEGYPDEVDSTPINKIRSIWVSGKYLNMSFKMDYHSQPHKAAVFRDMQADKPTLYFSYSRGEDPPGAPTLTYCSFNIESLQKKNFIIRIKTKEGLKEYLLPR